MQVDGVEGHLPHDLEPEEDHPRHPEEEDVVAGLHHRPWVEPAQIGGLVRPAQASRRATDPEENQVSSTSGSCSTGPPQAGQAASDSSTVTIVSPHCWQYQTGMRCPHQSWREMHQSWMFSSQLR